MPKVSGEQSWSCLELLDTLFMVYDLYYIGLTVNIMNSKIYLLNYYSFCTQKAFKNCGPSAANRRRNCNAD